MLTVLAPLPGKISVITNSAFPNKLIFARKKHLPCFFELCRALLETLTLWCSWHTSSPITENCFSLEYTYSKKTSRNLTRPFFIQWSKLSEVNDQLFSKCWYNQDCIRFFFLKLQLMAMQRGNQSCLITEQSSQRQEQLGYLVSMVLNMTSQPTFCAQFPFQFLFVRLPSHTNQKLFALLCCQFPQWHFRRYPKS